MSLPYGLLVHVGVVLTKDDFVASLAGRVLVVILTGDGPSVLLTEEVLVVDLADEVLCIGPVGGNPHGGLCTWLLATPDVLYPGAHR